MNYVYILNCKDQSLYKGWTNNIEKRLKVHHHGKGAKYTCSRRPVILVYTETFESKGEAMKGEYHILKMAKQQKLELIDKIV